jgi:predicted GTPase
LAKENISLFLAEQTAISLLRPDMPTDSELLKVAIIGAPNAGKSTIVNRLMGWRVRLTLKRLIDTFTNIYYYTPIPETNF